jgi:hypothetical protein
MADKKNKDVSDNQGRGQIHDVTSGKTYGPFDTKKTADTKADHLNTLQRTAGKRPTHVSEDAPDK